MVLSEELREDAPHRRPDEAEVEAPDLAGGGHLRSLDRPLDSLEDHPDLVVEHAAGVGDRHAPLRPVEELHADLGLQARDLLAQRRLDDVQPLRRASEVELLGDRGEVAEVA